MPSFPHPTGGRRLKQSGHSFRLTIHAGSKEAEWECVLASDPWKCMALDLPNSIADEANTYLSQGRDLFRAAETAGGTSRPLLLYYSFMNLAKALIKAERPGVDLRGAIHGVDEPSTNRQAQRFRLTAQQVHIQNARPNRAHILAEFATLLQSTPLPHGRTYNVATLLGQIPAIHRSYSQIVDKPESLHPIADGEFRFDQAARRLWALVRVKRRQPKSLDGLTSRQYFNAFFSQRESEVGQSQFATFETTPIAYSQNPRSALREFAAHSVQAGMCSLLTGQGYRYYLSDFQPGVRVHWGIAAYLTMFYFGSLARYRPTHLSKILNGKYAWAVEEFFATQPAQFLYLIASTMLRREVVRPMALI